LFQDVIGFGLRRACHLDIPWGAASKPEISHSGQTAE
jgi:hypothetical protein